MNTEHRGRVYRSRANVLLIEIMLVLLFFALASTVLVRVFAGAYNLSSRAGDIGTALYEAQSAAEILSQAGDVRTAAQNAGFISTEHGYEKQCGNLLLCAVVYEEPAYAGQMRTGSVQVLDGDTVLCAPAIARYIPGEELP